MLICSESESIGYLLKLVSTSTGAILKVDFDPTFGHMLSVSDESVSSDSCYFTPVLKS